MQVPMEVIDWAATECARQRSGELSVARLLRAWGHAKSFSIHRDTPVGLMTSWIIRNWAGVIHPANDGYRAVPVTINNLEIGSAPEHIERQVRLLCENQQNISLDSLVKSFLEAAPASRKNLARSTPRTTGGACNKIK